MGSSGGGAGGDSQRDRCLSLKFKFEAGIAATSSCACTGNDMYRIIKWYPVVLSSQWSPDLEVGVSYLISVGLQKFQFRVRWAT